MTETQKIIKYCAIAFAVLIMINIFSVIVWGISFMGNFIGDNNIKENNSSNKMQVISKSIEYIENIELDLNYTDLEIKTGDSFKIKTDNSKLKYINNNGNVVIKEKNKSNLFNNKNKKRLIIIIPENASRLNELDIELGAGISSISNLEANSFSLEQGAGETKIDNLTVIGETDIESGAGTIKVTSSKLNNLNIELGAGNIKLDAILTGNNEIEAGTGNIKVNLLDDISNYSFKVDKGIGNVNINNEKIENNTKYGTGNTYVTVNGGIGNIDIK